VSSKDLKDGKSLERLVAFVEKLSLPDGFAVETNKRVQNQRGNDEAEFDIVISGSVGSAKMVWLIECRDRPSSRSAPVSWIEQLVGRRDRFQVNKVTAVSTQPFSQPARTLAATKGIDLRQVKSLAVDEFEDWLRVPAFLHTERIIQLTHAEIIVPDDLPEAIGFAAGKRALESPNEPFLRSTGDGRLVHPKDAFAGIVEERCLFDGIEPNSPPKSVSLVVQYLNPLDRFVIETELGAAPVESIRFVGELFIREASIPLESVFEYRDVNSESAISQTATYGSIQVGDNRWALTLHKDETTGETKVLLVNSKPH
jgi:hypothetical protein